MENLPKNNVYKTPEGYFESLSDRILENKEKRKSRTLAFVRMTAAAAIVLIGVFFFILKNQLDVDQGIEANLEQEINLYINSGHWEAEDILSFSENPNTILDEIIAEEWESVGSNQTETETEDWW
jgi:hypothetical protein